MSANDYKMIRVTGSEARQFLQGQLTQDMERVAGSVPAAWCNHKGRVITVLRVLEIDGGYGLVLPAALAEAVCKRLVIYRLRTDVAIEIAAHEWSHRVMRSAADMAQLEALGLRPAQQMNACLRAHALTAVNIGIDEACVEVFGRQADFEDAGIDTGKHVDYEFLAGARIRAGIPEILEATSEKYTPHMLNLDLLGAVSFDKGCYTGQEVVARTQNLGKVKRRTMRYRAEGRVSIGDSLRAGEVDAGDVILVSGNDLLAVTPVGLRDRELLAGNIVVTPAALPYALPE